MHTPKRGLIALDIDGTTTAPPEEIPVQTLDYLHSLHLDGWEIAFITGRNFSWGAPVLQNIDFPYHVAVQNGAITLVMPEAKPVISRYLGADSLPVMEEICRVEPTDVVLYTGFEQGDRCYYRPHCFDPRLRDFLQRRLDVFQEIWIAVDSFEDVPTQKYASLKCFGEIESLERIAVKVRRHLNLHIPVIRDPFDEGSAVAQATHPLVSKGRAATDLKKHLGVRGPIIAAGDDYNDVAMWEVADVRVVMATAPDSLKEKADVIAPPASECGIIQGLTAAIALTEDL